MIRAQTKGPDIPSAFFFLSLLFTVCIPNISMQPTLVLISDLDRLSEEKNQKRFPGQRKYIIAMDQWPFECV